MNAFGTAASLITAPSADLQQVAAFNSINHIKIDADNYVGYTVISIVSI